MNKKFENSISKQEQKLPNELYLNNINSIILTRFRFVALAATVIVLGYSIIDHIVYPDLAPTFLKIRIFDSLFIFTMFLLSFHKKLESYGLWLINGIATAILVGLSIMVFMSDGSASRYYEGFNLVLIGVGIVNSFFVWNNIIFFSFWILCYEIAMLLSHHPFDLINFCLANAFMISTAILVILMSKFYREQHFKSFQQREQIKISENKLASLFNQADQLSKTDELTSIHNRRYFFEILKKTMFQCETSQSSFYLIIFDVDYFKEINDTYGHAFGDNVLIKIVNVVKKEVRSNDFIGRYGGDEFIICLGVSDYATVENRLIKIKDNIKSLVITHGELQIPVSVSIGAAKFTPGKGVNEKQLMEKADEQLLEVKRSKRGEIRITD